MKYIFLKAGLLNGVSISFNGKNAVTAETTEQLAKGLRSYSNRKRLEGGLQD